jgi:tRNA pseudouridine38-40 synthase
MSLAFKLDYFGAAFHGWQRQPGLATVQAALEEAFASLTGQHVSFTGCGRTDAGVHARGYVASARTQCGIPLAKLPLAMNAKLPKDVSVREAYAVDDQFHPVFSCTAKEYTYTIQNGHVRDPFYNDRALFVPAKLDYAAMCTCAREFLGEHDFSSMRTLGSNVKTTVREVYALELASDGSCIRIRIRANGFLYNMARTMAGTLLYAGLGKLKPGDITKILEGRDRCAAGPTLDARGLCMTGVWYPEPYAALSTEQKCL